MPGKHRLSRSTVDWLLLLFHVQRMPPETWTELLQTKLLASGLLAKRVVVVSRLLTNEMHNFKFFLSLGHIASSSTGVFEPLPAGVYRTAEETTRHRSNLPPIIPQGSEKPLYSPFFPHSAPHEREGSGESAVR